jgi:hypothetical protein
VVSRSAFSSRPPFVIRQQSFGEAMNTPALEGLARYELHLDRKFEKTITMLIRFQQMKGQDVSG